MARSSFRESRSKAKQAQKKSPVPGKERVASQSAAEKSGESRSQSSADFDRASFERHAAELGSERMSKPMYALQRSEYVHDLQRTYGNRYVQRLVEHIDRKRKLVLQTKMTVGSADDAYEREADDVAKQVVESLVDDGKADVQRQVEEEEELQMKPLQGQISASGGEVDAELERSIDQMKGNGSPIADGVRAPMEEAFGSDFSGVRVHSNKDADAMNRQMGARAFTTGQDIFIRQGDYKPASPSGRELLAHELTHVVQQGGSQPLQTLREDSIQRAIIPRIRQAFGYKIGSDASKKLLENAFEGREFDVSNISIVSEAELKKKYDEATSEGEYDQTGGLEGFTDVDTGEIYINKDAQAVDTVPHEVLHKNSDTAVGIQMGTNLDEGITEYLTQKTAKKAGFKPSSSYPNDLAVIQKLAALVSDGPIEKAYFDGDVDGLKTALDAKKEDGTFDSLVVHMKAESYADAGGLL